MRGQLTQRVQVVDRNAEETVHLRCVQRHRQHATRPGGDEQVSHQPAADRDAGRVLLVGAGIGVVGQYDGRPRGRSAAGGVEHEQQLDEVLLDGRDERLDEEDVPLPAVGLQLDLETVVGEPGHPYRPQWDLEVVTDLRRQLRMRAATEDRDLSQLPLPFLPPVPAEPNDLRVRGGRWAARE